MYAFDLVELRRCCTLRRRLATAIIIIIKILLQIFEDLYQGKLMVIR